LTPISLWAFSFLKCQVTVMIRLSAFLSVSFLPLPSNRAFYSNTFRLSIRCIYLLCLSALHHPASSRTKFFKHPLPLPEHRFWYQKPLRRVIFDIQFHRIFRFSETALKINHQLQPSIKFHFMQAFDELHSKYQPKKI